jgi:DNA ligase-1
MFKPMLAARPDVDMKLSELKYPCLASPKLDGIRCCLIDRVAYSRRLKHIPNKYVRKKLSTVHYNLDGELMVGNSFQAVTSGIMSQDGEPDFTYYVFDIIGLLKTFNTRYSLLKALDLPSFVKVVPHKLIKSPEQLADYEKKQLAAGYEGVMVRDPIGPYKYGRSTMSERYLVKIKRFQDDEAKIIGFEELLSNQNEKKRNELGYAKRSNHKANMVPRDTLGALIVRNTQFGTFNIGSGFDMEMRNLIWNNKRKFLGKLVKFKYQDYGIKDKPRGAVFLGIRDRRD